MSEFVFLFRGGEASGSPEQMQQQMQKWAAWMKDLAEKGHTTNAGRPGRPLERSGKLVKGKQKIVTDGPFAETKDLVGGYMLVEARDLEHAVKISLGCPILDNGGLVEVRPVMEMNM